MMGYYLHLALRTLRRNVILTSLIIAAVGVGIGAYMTMLAVLIAMSGDPIPDKSDRLFVPQIDSAGPVVGPRSPAGPLWLPEQLTYTDATALMHAHVAPRQAAMYAVQLDVTPPRGAAYSQPGRATYRDFFEMFDAPFAAGAAWSVQDETGLADVVVLGATLAARLFPHGSAVGQTVSLNGRLYRVTGVLKSWNPLPRFYDVNGNAFGSGEQLFIPFTTAIGRQLPTVGSIQCAGPQPPGWEGRLASACIWIQLWVELPDAAAVGRMLARFAARANNFGVRRALGASRADIFLQCLTETAVVGVLGGMLGLALTALGLAANRMSLSVLAGDADRLTHFDPVVMALTVALAVGATLCSGLYPTWRATRVQPGWQLKAQ